MGNVSILTALCLMAVALAFSQTSTGTPPEEKLQLFIRHATASFASSRSANEKIGSDVTSLNKRAVRMGRMKRSVKETYAPSPAKRVREFVGKRNSARTFQTFQPEGEHVSNSVVFLASDASAFHAQKSLSPFPKGVDPVGSYLPAYPKDTMESAKAKRIREFVGKRDVPVQNTGRDKRIREFVGKRISGDKRIREFVGKREIDDDLHKDNKGVSAVVGSRWRAAVPYAYRRRVSVDPNNRRFTGQPASFPSAGDLNKRIAKFVAKHGFRVPRTDYSTLSVGCGELCGNYEDGWPRGKLWLHQDAPRYFDYADNPTAVYLRAIEDELNPTRDQVVDLLLLWYSGTNVISNAPSLDIDTPVDQTMDADDPYFDNFNKRIREFVGKRSAHRLSNGKQIARESLGERFASGADINDPGFVTNSDKSASSPDNPTRGLTNRQAGDGTATRRCDITRNCDVPRLFLAKRIREFVGK